MKEAGISHRFDLRIDWLSVHSRGIQIRFCFSSTVPCKGGSLGKLCHLVLCLVVYGTSNFSKVGRNVFSIQCIAVFQEANHHCQAPVFELLGDSFS